MSSVVDITSNLAARLRAGRTRANLTQAELARRLAVSVRSVQSWEQGVFPQPRHRRAVAAFLAEVEGNGGGGPVTKEAA